ncbi:selenide, water dikinase SelD [Aurantimonas sp. VKM B-3413]|nr:selenide, water dikinase SelD [Aurantimonas sp. VKM B-3413]
MTDEGIKRRDSLFLHSACGGCSAKVSQEFLSSLTSLLPSYEGISALLTGSGGNEDAAIYALNESVAVVASVDVIAPPVDDPMLFGEIAAANALSDIYASGGVPLLCLAILAVPEKLGVQASREILAGVLSKVHEAGALLGGGHTVHSDHALAGLAVVGTAPPSRILRNSTARPGDLICMSKPIGTGVAFSALRAGHYDMRRAAPFLISAAQLNADPGLSLSAREVHALTDITGYGLVGHALEMARASDVTIRINAGSVPLFPGVLELYQDGYQTSLTARNLAWCQKHLKLAFGLSLPLVEVLADPQTNGGLLLSASPDEVGSIVSLWRKSGFSEAAIIGEVLERCPHFVEVAP